MAIKRSQCGVVSIFVGITSACQQGGTAEDAGSVDASETAPNSTETGSGELASGTTSDGRALIIPDDFELCIVSPSNKLETFSSSPLFSFRGKLRLMPDSISLPESGMSEQSNSIQFELQTSPSGPVLAGDGAEGTASVAEGSVPHLYYFLADADGWETAIYVDNPDAPTVTGDRLLVQVAYPAGTAEFGLAPLVELDRELRLAVIGFVPDPVGEDAVLRARAVPCEVLDAQFDRYDVTLAEGTISFHTRAAIWRKFGGFTVLSQGNVDGIEIEVDSYWDLEYATSAIGEDYYALEPLLAVRFAEQSDGSCILLLKPEAQSESYVASILDCEQNELRTLTVESIDFVPGGGEPRW